MHPCYGDILQILSGVFFIHLWASQVYRLFYYLLLFYSLTKKVCLVLDFVSHFQIKIDIYWPLSYVQHL